ncbi:MAG: muramidase [Magnetococcales bacterium]|nr:rod-binding protein [Magnetococcales bacterium]NGZ25285.1 muramidase [Magnetococcales bacterium]
MEIPPLQQAMPQINQKDEKKLKEAVSGFESIFLQQMLSSMRQTLPEGSLLNGGQGEKMFRDLLDQEYAKQMSQHQNQRGLKETLFQQLTMARSPRISGLQQTMEPPVKE